MLHLTYHYNICLFFLLSRECLSFSIIIISYKNKNTSFLTKKINKFYFAYFITLLYSSFSSSRFTISQYLLYFSINLFFISSFSSINFKYFFEYFSTLSSSLRVTSPFLILLYVSLIESKIYSLVMH